MLVVLFLLRIFFMIIINFYEPFCTGFIPSLSMEKRRHRMAILELVSRLPRTDGLESFRHRPPPGVRSGTVIGFQLQCARCRPFRKRVG